MRFVGNILWLLFGGFETAIGYFTGSLGLAITIIGLPLAWQTFKLGVLCLWPFGATTRNTPSPTGCLRIVLNIAWLIFGGLGACLSHVLWGVLLFITIIGIPFAKQHFKMAGFALSPFGKDVDLSF
ncbi:MAG: YccF domain-containing protein [Bacteroidales bacterium]|nr:YccF domain-containing protein [Bacteroidales bacterium]MDD7725712.1 YccF domain-containing protein [Bacteroidales bacterium]MDY4174440.1 YccF domain-containing protein [Bacteroidales bacterium]